jgi:hypothetical protein
LVANMQRSATDSSVAGLTVVSHHRTKATKATNMQGDLDI